MSKPKDNSRTHPPAPPSLFLRVAVVIVVPLLIIILGTTLVLRNFNPNRYAPALVTALEQITGRQVTLKGPVTIRWSLTPYIQASDIAIANPPGFPDHNVLTLDGLRADIGLMSLFSHRIDVLKLVLIAPHLTLERLPDGRADWDFSTGGPHGAVTLQDPSLKVALEAVEVENGLVTIHGADGKPAGIIHLTKLTGTADSLSSPLHLTAQAEIGATPFTISGMVGPIERFSGIGTGPWPLNLDFMLAGAKLNFAGTVKHPGDARGYDLAVSLNILDLNVLGQALPASITGSRALPAVQNIAATLHIKDRAATLPLITGAKITAGKSDLSSFQPGLALAALTVNMPALDQPFTMTATGTSGSGNFSLQGQFGAVQNLINPAWLPAGANVSGNFPVSVTALLGSANAMLTGAITNSQTLSGTALAFTATIPDLSALSAVAGMPLPAWKHISIQTTLVDPGGEGLYNSAGLDDLIVKMDNAAFGGDATLTMAPQPKLQLALNFTQANIDALLAAFPPPAVAAPPATPVQPAAPAPSVPPVATFIPDTVLPLGFLSWGNADIQLAADNVTWRGASYTALQANAALAGGKLTIAPFTGQTPGGNVTANASIDTSVTPAVETLAIHAPALALGPLIKSLKLDGAAEGNLQLQLTANSTGNTLHEIASNLNGQLGLASVNDLVDTGLLDSGFGPIETAAGIPQSAATPAAIRCFGLLVTAKQGIANVQTFGLDSTPLTLQGSGSLDFSKEVYNLTFLPAEGAPVQLGGSFAQPTFTATPQPLAAPPQPIPPAGAVPVPPPPRPDICPATLAQARLGLSGPDAPPMTIPGTPPPAAASNAPKNLLNSLLGP